MSRFGGVLLKRILKNAIIANPRLVSARNFCADISDDGCAKQEEKVRKYTIQIIHIAF